MAEEKLAESPYGNLYYINGEVNNRANLSDPVAYRGSKAAKDVGPGSTAIVFIGADIRRSDNVNECVGQITGRMDDRFDKGHEGTAAAGSWEVFCRAPNAGSTDQAMRKVLTLTYDRAIFHVPVYIGDVESQGFPNQPAAPIASGSNEFMHPDGKFWFVMQGDGNMVIYENGRPFDKTTATPIWSTGTGGRIPAPPAHSPQEPIGTNPVTPTGPTGPSEPKAVQFNYLGINYTVHEGDFAAMEHIFKVLLDASDVVSYHNGDLSWAQVLEKFLRKVDGDNISA